jgi:Uma2 family endonuclease
MTTVMTSTSASAARDQSSWDSSESVVLHAIPWALYEALLVAAGDDPGIRMTYNEGTLEIMSPSNRHEHVKTMIARLVEAYSEECDLVFNGFGSATFKNAERGRGLEPDECYVVTTHDDLDPERPDLAIEVQHTSWKTDRLEVHAGLGVPEVWRWRQGTIEVYVLRDDGHYEPRERSELLPGLDLALVARFAVRTDQVRAVKEFRALVRR